MPDDVGLHLPGFTLAFWVRVLTIPPETGVAVIVSKDQSGDVAGDFAIRMTDGGLLIAQFQDGAGGRPEVQHPALPNVDYHVAVTAGATGFSLWVDGRLRARSAGYTDGWTANAQAIQFASAPWTQWVTEMVLHHAALYGRELNAGEIAALAQRADETGAADLTDAHGQRLRSVGDPVAVWQPGTGTTVADASGHGRAGVYNQTPNVVGDITWHDAGGDTAVDYGGVLDATIAHDAAYELATFSLSADVLPTKADITNERTILQKGADFQIKYANVNGKSGNVELVIGRVTLATLTADPRGGTTRGFITAGRRFTVTVMANPRRVWLIVDGYRAARSEAHTAGLTGNTKDWRLGISTGGERMTSTLGRVVLYAQALYPDDIDALWEKEQMFLPYPVPGSPEITEVGPFDKAVDIQAAVATARPNTHVLVSGVNIDDMTLVGEGADRQPIVIRPANEAQRPTITGTWTINGASWLVIEGMNADNGQIVLTGGAHHIRVTRQRNRNIASRSCYVVQEAHDVRIDHGDLSDRRDNPGRNLYGIDIQGGALRDGLVQRILLDHMYVHDLVADGANAQEPYRLGAGMAIVAWARIIIEQGLCDTVDITGESELIGIKTSGVRIRRMTFKDVGSMYVQFRQGQDGEIGECYWTGGSSGDQMRAWGDNCYYYGNKHAGNGKSLALGWGDGCTTEKIFAGRGGDYNTARDNLLVGNDTDPNCEVTVGKRVKDPAPTSRSPASSSRRTSGR